MLKAASVLLSIWSGINLLLALSILSMVVVLKKNAPMLFIVFEESEIPMLNHKATSAVNALAILFNSSIAAFSLLALCVVWSSLISAEKWAFWVLLVTIGLSQAFGFVADSITGNKTLYVNMAMSALYLSGMLLAGLAIYK